MNNIQSIINKFNQAAGSNSLAVDTMADCVNTINSMLIDALKSGVEQQKALDSVKKENEDLKKKLDNSLAENQELKSGLEALKNQIFESKPNLPEFEESDPVQS